MNLIITMAGAGSRFRQAGYSQPKYQIEVCGNNLFTWAMKSLKHFYSEENTFIFIVQQKEHAKNFIVEQCRQAGIPNIKILEIDGFTDGQASTAMYAEKCIRDYNEPVAVYNIDTYVDPQYLKPDMIHGEGWIPCFPGPGEHWSFARLDKNGKVTELKEKQRVSPHATIGFYWFKSFDIYKNAYQSYYTNPQHLEKGEKYIAPLYNQMITDGLDVYIEKIPLFFVHGLGTPLEVTAFAEQHKKTGQP